MNDDMTELLRLSEKPSILKLVRDRAIELGRCIVWLILSVGLIWICMAASGYHWE